MTDEKLTPEEIDRLIPREERIDFDVVNGCCDCGVIERYHHPEGHYVSVEYAARLARELEELRKGAAASVDSVVEIAKAFDVNSVRRDIHAAAVMERDALAKRVEELEAERGHSSYMMLDEARAENERLRMQLTACGVVADSNTEESAARNRDMHPDYRSASCGAVADAVDREMVLRKQLDKAVGALEEISGLAGDSYYDMSTTLGNARAEIKAVLNR